MIENVESKRSFKKKKRRKSVKKPIPKKTGTKQKALATKERTENFTEQDNGSDKSKAECPSCGLVYECVKDD